ncbi:hypothetical protein V5799_009865 [Amblyomma americanum]|uniref:Uncharacterized protein n=1 Tax=Amblyomma americanum TaxID=6943 RepID=A0AAQ4FAE3_AMBAM
MRLRTAYIFFRIARLECLFKNRNVLFPRFRPRRRESPRVGSAFRALDDGKQHETKRTASHTVQNDASAACARPAHRLLYRRLYLLARCSGVII